MATVNPNDFGSVEILHKGKTIPTTVGSPKFESFLLDIEKNYVLDVGFVPAGFQNRPDLISELFYDTPEYFWFIMVANNIPDPFEGLSLGDRVIIPKI